MKKDLLSKTRMPMLAIGMGGQGKGDDDSHTDDLGADAEDDSGMGADGDDAGEAGDDHKMSHDLSDVSDKDLMHELKMRGLDAGGKQKADDDGDGEDGDKSDGGDEDDGDSNYM